MDAEVRGYADMVADEKMRNGMTPDEARRAARMELGGVEQVKEQVREARAGAWLDSLLQDLRYGARMLWRSPGFTVVAVLTLALGIGANTAIFSLVDAVMLRNLPVSNPQELVLFSDDVSEGVYSGEVARGLRFLYTYYDYGYFRDHGDSFRSLCAFESNRHKLKIRTSDSASVAGVKFAHGKVISGNYFSVLGVKPITGRLLSADDDRAGASPVAVMSYDYWHRVYNDDPEVIGRSLEINDTSVTIVGVTPPGFYGETLHAEDFWFPLIAYPQVARRDSILEDRSAYWLNMIGRLKPGVTLREAQAAVNVQLRQILVAQAGPDPSARFKQAIADSHIKLVPGARGISLIRAEYSKPLEILMAAVGFVLLIACANVANLLLSRASTREKEISVRIAIGASRARLVRQLLTESLLLGVCGAALGILFARWAAQFLLVTIAGSGSLVTISASTRVLAFTMGVSLVSVVIFGLLPAFTATHSDVAASMKNAPAEARAIPALFGGSNALVVFQIAMTLPLLVAAGLFVRTLHNLLSEPLGFQDDHVLVAAVDPELVGYKPAELPALYRSLLDRVSSIPGVASVTLDSTTPFGGYESAGSISIEGRSSRGSSGSSGPEELSTHFVQVGAHYFETLGIPIVLGRDISPGDIQQGRKVAVINQTLARKYFGNSNPIGRRCSSGSPFDPGSAFEIVGVAADARYYTIRDAVPPTMFNAAPAGRYLVIRTSGDRSAVQSEAQKVITEVAPRSPSIHVLPLASQVEGQFGQDRTVADLSSLLGGLALLLACVGLYGTMAYRVSRRTSEIGIRMALGAQRFNVILLIMKECILTLFFGVAIGLALAFFSARLIVSQLFGVSALDPVTIAAVTVLLTLVAIAACFGPASRAMKIDPIVALRHE